MEGDGRYSSGSCAIAHFYPRPPGGGRLQRRCRFRATSRFLSTPSGWRATLRTFTERRGQLISIHALRVEGDLRQRIVPAIDAISIHALRVEGDALPHAARKLILPYFYPRPPGGGRPCTSFISSTSESFLSTPSGWRATFALLLHSKSAEISIHALRVEGDYRMRHLSAWSYISIHALRVEGDAMISSLISSPPYFYPRPPGGGRPNGQILPRGRHDFYPRPPGGGRLVADFQRVRIVCDFYPRPPGGGRRRVALYGRRCWIISIHALRVEGDLSVARLTEYLRISIHALRVEGDPLTTKFAWLDLDFYPRPPGGGRR